LRCNPNIAAPLQVLNNKVQPARGIPNTEVLETPKPAPAPTDQSEHTIFKLPRQTMLMPKNTEVAPKQELPKPASEFLNFCYSFYFHL
jgi:hypothetical protein